MVCPVSFLSFIIYDFCHFFSFFSGEFDKALVKQFPIFGIGGRSCPGKDIARLDSVAILGNVLWRYRLTEGVTFTEDTFKSLSNGILKRPKVEPQIRLTRRSRAKY